MLEYILYLVFLIQLLIEKIAGLFMPSCSSDTVCLSVIMAVYRLFVARLSALVGVVACARDLPFRPTLGNDVSAAVKRIVEKIGGEVGVKSNLGEGSEFYFTLPSEL